MEAYRVLMKEYQPVNRARSLELFHQILNYRFHPTKGIAENILEYEERIEQYEKSTGEKVQENLKVSTLIQGMKPEVKRHLLLNLDEKTKYQDLRQYLVNYESTERWTNSLAQQQQQGTPYRTTTDLIDKGEDHGGLAAMDINQAYGKGKWFSKGGYKGKGFGKGKGKDFGKAKDKVKAEAEVETGKVEVEVSENTKAEVEEDSKEEVKASVVLAATKAKEKLKQQQESATTVTSMDTSKHSVDRSSVTWVTKLGT